MNPWEMQWGDPQAAAQPAAPPAAPPSAPKPWEMQYDKPVRGLGERTLRLVGNYGAGANEGIAGTLGAIPDLYNRGLAAAGLPHMPQGYYQGAVQSGLNAVVGEPPTPETMGERAARGAGRGTADAAAAFIPAAGVAQAAKAGTVTQGVAQALATQPATQAAAGAVGGAVGEATDSPLAGAAAGLAAGLAPGLAGAAAQRAGSGVRGAIVGARENPEEQSLVAAADRLGIPLSPAQRGGGRALQKIEGAFDDFATTAGAQATQKAGQQEAYNRAALKVAGIDAPAATRRVLDDAAEAFNTRWRDVTARNTLREDPQLGQDLLSIAQAAAKSPDVDKAQVTRWLTGIYQQMQKNGGTLPGEEYHNYFSSLGRAIKGASGNTQHTLTTLREALADGMERSISPEDFQSWSKLRREYANYKTIEDVVGRSGVDPAVGNIPFGALAGAVRRSVGTAGYAHGRSDLDEVARIGQVLLKPQVANSQTPSRLTVGNVLTGGALLGGDLTGAGLTLALPPLVRAVYEKALKETPGAAANPAIQKELLAAILAQQARVAAGSDTTQ